MNATNPPIGRRAIRAFTLIELMVVVAIIGVLMGLIVPVAAKARSSAQSIASLSNLRQIGMGFTLYTDAERNFPSADKLPEAYKRTRWSFGGVNVLPPSNPNPVATLPRPLNAYLDLPTNTAALSEVYHSPADDGLFYMARPNEAPWERLGMQTEAGIEESAFLALGTSYFANEWMWCIPGSTIGFHDTNGPGSAYTTKLGPRSVTTDAWRFVVAGGAGQMEAGRYDNSEMPTALAPEGFWYGPRIGHLAFLDGSVRAETMTRGADTPQYTFYVDPRKHKTPAHWRTAFAP